MSNKYFARIRSLAPALVASAIASLCLAPVAQAAVTVQVINGYNLVVDSNVTSPSTYAPSAAYIGAKICNTGPTDVTNVFAYTGNYTPPLPATAPTPGIFPLSTPTNATIYPSIANSGSYSLTLEGGRNGISEATRYIGTLKAGECRVQYWLISYPQCKNVLTNGVWTPQAPPCTTSITGDVKPTDDLKLNYDIWVTSSAGTVSSRRDFTLRNEISAAANKIWPNTAAKVPDAYLTAIQSVIGWGTLGPDGQPLGTGNPVYPGQRVITTQGIWYDLGNVGQGFDNNGDLVPDQNAWLQPVGDAAAFDAGCFRMVNVYGIVIVKLKTGGEKLIPFQNELYFENIPDNTGVVGLVYYQFIATQPGCSAAMTPYQEAASGFDNEKFSADFGLSNPLTSAPIDPAKFTFSKTDGVASTSAGATLTYSATTTNTTGVHLGAPEFGVPLVIKETIPAGTTYVAATANVNRVTPSGNGTYTQGYTDTAGNLDNCTINYQIDPANTYWVVLFSTDDGVTWTATEPAAASVTNIQWMLVTTLLLDGSHNGTDCVAPDTTFNDGTFLTSLPGTTETGTQTENTMSVGFRVQVNPRPIGIIAASGTPIAITTSSNHGLRTGDRVTIAGVGGNTNANGTRTVTVTGARTFTLDGSTSNAAYTSGGTVTPLANPPVICNTATAGYGVSAATSATDCDVVSGINSLSGTIFKDDGSGGGTYGNGIKDNVSEVGIGAASPGGVLVTLYYDLNGNGTYDSSDILYATTTTDANGNYSFSSLPDGPFLVAAKKYATSGTDHVASFVPGWGSTTTNPGEISLVTDQGIVKLSESASIITLAVNIDYLRDSATAQAVTNVNFSFAPPLRVTKGISGNPDANLDGKADATINEGATVNYVITLENRLPSMGRQGPSGCEYTVWAPSGATGNSPKDFANPANAWDGPNRTVASALVEKGGLRWLTATGFAMRPQPGNISKVEALYLGYFNTPLNDDQLNLQATLGGTTVTRTLNAALIDSFIGAPAELDPNSAIPWDLTNNRPGGGAWTWADAFSALTFYVNPDKAASADKNTFYLDAVGLRITTDRACEAVPSSTLSPVPLQDTWDVSNFQFVSAVPTPTSVDTVNGVIRWADVGPIIPGSSTTVTVTMRGYKNLTGTITGGCTAAATTPPSPASTPLANNSLCNWAETKFLDGAISRTVYYADGRPATDASSSIAANMQGNAEIRGTVWKDNNNDGWPNNDAEPGLPNVGVTLWGCVRIDGTMETAVVNKTCEAQLAGNAWKIISTTTTNTSGNYEFIGLNGGYYLVEVGNTDNVPGTGNATPYSSTQTAEPNDTQAVTAGLATGTNGICAGGCNNTWGSPTANLNALNLLNSPTGEEIIGGVNFGYYMPSASVYGNVWWDRNANGDTVITPEPGEAGLAGFTVTITNGTTTLRTTTDVNGNYQFGNLPAGTYTITVTPPTLLSKVWVETVETNDGGTKDATLNNQMSVSLLAGDIKGSFNFAYTQQDQSKIGDTLYFDLNANGVQDPLENGIPGITVWLYSDADRDGMIDAGLDTIVRTTTTDGSGKYLFTALPAGTYIVKVDRADPDFPSDTVATVDPDLTLGSIGDFVYVDSNGNGVWNTGEDGISRVVVNLYADTNRNLTFDAGDLLVKSTLTSAETRLDGSGQPLGNYLFTSLPAGGYFVAVDATTVPAGFAVTSPSSGISPLITLASNAVTATNTTADFGFSPAANFALGNRLWHDVNSNNLQDAGEVGFGDVDVIVTGPACPAPGCRTTTNAAGFWYVAGLTPGAYTVTVDTNDVDFPRNFTATATPPASYSIVGADVMNADRGYAYSGTGASPTGTITGRVYQDVNANGQYDAGTDTPRTATTVNLIDSTGEVVATTTSATDGTYSFNGVFVGTYTVEARDLLGRRYSTIFLSAAETFPNLNVVYNAVYSSAEAANDESSVNTDGVHANLLQDFGYKRYLASIGDTIYHDVNENGTQDIGEPGFANVTVKLYVVAFNASTDADGFFEAGEGIPYIWTDSNGNGSFDASEGTASTWGAITPFATTTTIADNTSTSANEGGTYLFSNLPTLPTISGTQLRYVVVVDKSTIGGVGTTVTEIADPDTDGTPCTQLLMPGAPLYEAPPKSVCDNNQLVSGFLPGSNYLGADFGYRITGSGYGSFGDQVWIDTQLPGETGYGIRDSFERGIPAITVWLDTNNDGLVSAGEPTTQTDIDGFYAFTNIADGTYNVRVLTTDPDWPSSSLQASYEARDTNTASLNSYVQVVVSGGNVTSIIDGDPATTDTSIPVQTATTTELKTCGTETNCNLSVDFAYRSAGADSLSGTVCLDDTGKNGYCGNTAGTFTGVGTGETALSGVQVSLYAWTDNPSAGTIGSAWTGATLDSADTFRFVGSRTTGTSGDYSFTNVDLTDDVIVVFSTTDTQSLRLTTTTANTSVAVTGLTIPTVMYEGTTTYDGNTVTVLTRQLIKTSATGSDTFQGVDYAFEQKVPVPKYDFGDLPASYAATTAANSGAEHIVTPSIFLGSGVSADLDGTPSANATGEPDTAAEGVVLNGTEFQRGGTASVTVKVGGVAGTTGWLIGWIDFNGDGDFNDIDDVPDPSSLDQKRRSEMIINQQVTSTGTALTPQTITFDIPWQITPDPAPSQYFARFRLYTSQPAITSTKGIAIDSTFNPIGGEVEDYMFTAALVTAVDMETIDAKQGKKYVTLTWKTSKETRNLGFNVYRQAATGSRERLNDHLIVGSAFATRRQFNTLRTYKFTDKNPPSGFVQYYVEDVDLNGEKTLHGPVTPQLTNDEPPVTTEPDPTLGSVGGIFTSPAGVGVTIPAPPAPATAQLEEQWKLAAVPAVKVVVTQPGWYSVKKSDLVKAGFDPGSNAKVISVFTDGVEVPVVVTGKNPAQFTDNDAIEFFGRGIDTIGTGGRVYYITPKKGNALRVKSVGGKGNSGAPAPAGYPFTFERIERTVFFSALINNGDRENFFGTVVAIDPYTGAIPTQYVTVANRDTTATAAELELVLQGASENIDHVVEVALNGMVVGDVRFSGVDRTVAKLSVPASLLVAGENTITMMPRNGDEDVSAVESLRLTYSHLFRADDDALAFKVAGGTAVTVGGFTTANIRVVDVTDPTAPFFIDGTISAAKDGTQQVAFATTGQDARTIFAFANNRVLPPAEIAWNEASTWNAASNGAKLVIISNRAFVPAAKKLAAARQAQGIPTAVVDVQNVYDEFSYGHHGPQAIKDFLAHASKIWSVKPKYVILLGDATYDPRDYYGFGSGDYVPTKLVATTYVKTASDDWFADFNNTGVPSLAIGRIPVRTAEQAEGVVAKLIARTSVPSAAWAKNVDVISDAPIGYPFDLDADAIAGVVPKSLTANRVRVNQVADPSATILSGFNRGSILTTWVGHGWYNFWGSDWYNPAFTADSAGALDNREKLPFVIVLNCFNGFFHDSWFETTAEALTNNANGGAIGVWASSAMTTSPAQVAMTLEFYKRVLAAPGVTVGDAAIAAKAAITDQDVKRSWILFGDPTIPLR